MTYENRVICKKPYYNYYQGTYQEVCEVGQEYILYTYDTSNWGHVSDKHFLNRFISKSEMKIHFKILKEEPCGRASESGS